MAEILFAIAKYQKQADLSTNLDELNTLQHIFTTAGGVAVLRNDTLQVLTWKDSHRIFEGEASTL